MKLDAYDRKILAALQRDGRLSNVQLADEIGLSASPCLRRVRMLEDAGVIRGYQANLDRDEVGLGLTVFVGVKVERHNDEQAEAFRVAVMALPEVVMWPWRRWGWRHCSRPHPGLSIWCAWPAPRTCCGSAFNACGPRCCRT